MNNLEDVLLNPVRMRIVQHLSTMEGATVDKLHELMSDVPRTTLYRHVNILSKWGLLSIVREEKIRGTYRREYALSLERMYATAEGQALENSVYNFIVKLLSDFHGYFATPGADAVRDRLFLSKNTLMLSESEFERYIEEVFTVTSKYLNFTAEPGRRARVVSFISSPGATAGGSHVE